MHGHRMFRREDEDDFEATWRASVEMLGDPMRVENGRRATRYAERTLLGKYVDRALQVFPRERVHVVLFEDIATRPREVFDDVVRFLGLDPFSGVALEAKNTTMSRDASLLTRLATSLPPVVRRTLRRVGLANRGYATRLASRFGRTQERSPLRPEFRAELAAFYRADVERLGRAIGRDLDHWLRPPSR
jgi:hypothetical protein